MEVVTDASVVGNGALTGAAVEASCLRNGRGHGRGRDDRFIGRRKERRRARGRLRGRSAVRARRHGGRAGVHFRKGFLLFFQLLLQRLHRLGQRFNLLAQSFDVVRRRRRRRLLGKNGPLRANQRGGNKRFLQDKFFSALSGA